MRTCGVKRWKVSSPCFTLSGVCRIRHSTYSRYKWRERGRPGGGGGLKIREDRGID